MALPREKSLSWSLVIIRWVPHSTTGTSGTPAAAAIRTAPVLSALISMAREMVASGKMPTTSPRRRSSRATASEDSPSARSTWMWRQARMIGPLTRWSNSSRLAMNRSAAADPVDGQPAVDEVDVADVVERHQRAAGARQVLEAGDVIALPEDAEAELGEPDDRRVRQLGHGGAPYVARGRRPDQRGQHLAEVQAGGLDRDRDQGRLGEPGRDVHLQEPHRAVVATIRSERDSSRRPERLVGGHRDPGALGQDGGGQRRGYGELGGAGGVPRRVVVDAAVGLDGHHGQRARPAAVVDHRAPRPPCRPRSARSGPPDRRRRRSPSRRGAPRRSARASSPAPSRSWPA